jgi:hypothetical protein
MVKNYQETNNSTKNKETTKQQHGPLSRAAGASREGDRAIVHNVKDPATSQRNSAVQVRFPVLLTPAEKEIARMVSVAFKQKVCGFDLLRSDTGRSYVWSQRWSLSRIEKLWAGGNDSSLRYVAPSTGDNVLFDGHIDGSMRSFRIRRLGAGILRGSPAGALSPLCHWFVCFQRVH